MRAAASAGSSRSPASSASRNTPVKYGSGRMDCAPAEHDEVVLIAVEIGEEDDPVL